MRAFISGFAGTKLSSAERAFLREVQPWGVILFRRNIAMPEAVRALLDDVRATLGRSAPVLIDQEGGRVQRLTPPRWPSYPPGAAYGALYDRDRDAGNNERDDLGAPGPREHGAREYHRAHDDPGRCAGRLGLFGTPWLFDRSLILAGAITALAVMVLFLFVIMLLDLPAEERRKVRTTGLVLGLISVGTIIVIALRSLLQSPLNPDPAPSLEGSTVPLGRLLFTQYLLPFEIISVLLLVAMVGVILLSKRDLK